MYATTAEFKAAIRETHRAIIRCEVWRGDQQILTLEPESGQVEIDGRRGVRRTLSLTVAAPDPTIQIDPDQNSYWGLKGEFATYAALSASVYTYAALLLTDAQVETLVDARIVPDDGFDTLAPFGNEIRVWRGIEVTTEVLSNYAQMNTLGATYAAIAATYASYADVSRALGATEETSEELIPLGVFMITDVDVTTGPNGTTVAVQGSDRSLRISRSRWTEPYTSPGGAVTAAIQALLEDRWADVTCDFTTSTATTNKAVFGLETDNDPWKDALKIATAAGLDLYFDGDGIARLTPVRDYDSATPDAEYLENEEAMVLALTRRLTTDQTYNGVIAMGEGSEASATFRGEAWDDDPASPTYRYGPMGEVPLFYSSPLLTSDDMAGSTALTILARKKGAQESIEWTQIVDPSLDAGDFIAIQNEAAKVDRVLVLDRLTVPLDEDKEMTSVARTIRTFGSSGLDAE